MKYRVEIDGHTRTSQYAIIEAESEEKAIAIFNAGGAEYEYDFEDFEPTEQAEPVALEVDEG